MSKKQKQYTDNEIRSTMEKVFSFQTMMLDPVSIRSGGSKRRFRNPLRRYIKIGNYGYSVVCVAYTLHEMELDGTKIRLFPITYTRSDYEMHNWWSVINREQTITVIYRLLNGKWRLLPHTYKKYGVYMFLAVFSGDLK